MRCGFTTNGRKLAAATLAVACLTGAGWAGSDRIVLETSPSSRLKDGLIEAALHVTNRGATPLRDWHVEATLPDRSVRGEDQAPLEPGAARAVRIPLGAAPEPAGIYSLIFTTRYADRDGRPFSVLNHIPLVTVATDSLEGPLTIRMDAEPLRRCGPVRITLRNSGPVPIEARVRLFLPDEIRFARPADTVLFLDPGAETEQRIRIRRAGTLPGSRYTLIATADYRDGSAHWSAMTSATLSVEPAWTFALGRRVAWACALTLLTLWGFAQCRSRRTQPRQVMLCRSIFDIAIVVAVTAWIAWHLYPHGWFLDTLAVGGDIPAHSYLASHLAKNLFANGRIVTWAQGWWSGFPMFQFYFPLPYLAMALLGLVLPFNIAFKLVSVTGLLTLPVCLFAFGRLLRLPRPIPVLLTIIAIPLVFTRAHTMWGVNVYSTLAGMIANSLGFSLMLLFLGSAWHDADDGRFRLRTVLLFAALIASHFFTTLIAVLVAVLMPLLRPAAGFRKSFRVLAATGLCGSLLMAWWLIPLAAKIEYSVEFGQDWDVHLHRTLPFYTGLLVLGILAALLICPGRELWQTWKAYAPIRSARRHMARIWRTVRWHTSPNAYRTTVRIPGVRARLFQVSARFFRARPTPGAHRSMKTVLLLQWMLVASVLLFLYGSRIATVFDNIRLWPFIFFAFLALAATGFGWHLHARCAPELAVAAALLLAITAGTDLPNEARDWARWNFEGAEAKPGWPVLKELVLPLAGTPGRLANDLHPDNNLLGSTRIFESVPHLIGKPILEGGIVNSAAGSLFAYLVQGETSRSSAGYPAMVHPSTFDFGRGLRHLALFNVSHFIARHEETQAALEAAPDWHRIAARDKWSLFESVSNDGSYVRVPLHAPVGVRLEPGPVGLPWKQAGLDWFHVIAALDMPFVLLDPGETAPALTPTVSETEFRAHLAALENGRGDAIAFEPVVPRPHVSMLEFSDHRIRFRTDTPGAPHIVKVSHYPNWRVSGADKIYRVTPNFMLLYPDSPNVELTYGHRTSDRLGSTVSWTTMIGLLVSTFVYRSKRHGDRRSHAEQ